MSVTSSTSAVSSSNASSSAQLSSSTSTGELSKNFMQMLLAQLRNQDPLSPMDSAAMTGQLAQLNMVDGINTTNGLMQSVLTQIRQSSQMDLPKMTGQYALVDSESLQLMQAGESVQLETVLAEATDGLKLSIEDSVGNEVYTKNWGALSAGTVAFQWDGKDADGNALPAGRYKVKAWSGSGNGSKDMTMQVSQLVLQAGLDSSGVTQLYLANGQQVPVGNVRKWLAAA